jgi:hypothetical protein
MSEDVPGGCTLEPNPDRPKANAGAVVDWAVVEEEAAPPPPPNPV